MIIVQSSALGRSNHLNIYQRATNLLNTGLLETSIMSTAPFDNVFNYSDPNGTLTFWSDAFLSVVNKHAALRKKRVTHPKLPPWLTQDIIQAMALRDKTRA